MSQKPIVLVWGDGQSRRCHKPTAKEFEKLLDERRAHIEGLRLAKPVVSFQTTDLWDCLLLELVDYHFERGVATPYELAGNEMLRRQAEHTIRARFGINPRYLIQSLDRDARDIVRFIEASWADDFWIAQFQGVTQPTPRTLSEPRAASPLAASMVEACRPNGTFLALTRPANFLGCPSMSPQVRDQAQEIAKTGRS